MHLSCYTVISLKTHLFVHNSTESANPTQQLTELRWGRFFEGSKAYFYNLVVQREETLLYNDVVLVTIMNR